MCDMAPLWIQMIKKVLTATLSGIQAQLVTIEVDSSLGLPGFSMVGLPDCAVREARERVVSAMRSSGFQAMARRITVNLAPADIRKEGSAFDVALAVGMLMATEQLVWEQEERTIFLGELGLDGAVRPVRGVLSMALLARDMGMRVVVPKGNLSEAMSVDSLEVLGIESLRECVEVMGAGQGFAKAEVVRPPIGSAAGLTVPDFSSVQGMALAKRALEISAAGWHHFLMIGSPGTGKTLCAQCLPGILFPFGPQEAMEATRIHSCAGLLAPGAGILSRRLFRAPHHTASTASLVGGGRWIRPGEVSLAHHGVLFLDELPEFSRPSLEALRQPLEDGHVTIARANETISWPARFLFGAAMNPCPCGYAMDARRECSCSSAEVQRYRQRISGPMLDRIDLQIPVQAVEFDAFRYQKEESSEQISHRVHEAVQRQIQRNPSREGRIPWNSQLDGEGIRQHCSLPKDAHSLLDKASQSLSLSARGILRILKVSRTIADLRGADRIDIADVSEALQYRIS